MSLGLRLKRRRIINEVKRMNNVHSETHYINYNNRLIITIAFIIICTAVYIADPYFGFALTSSGLKSNALIAEEPYRLLTCTVLHKGFLHILFNMTALYYFGSFYESHSGSLKALITFISSGLSGSLCSFAFNSADSLGASGIVFGLMGASLSLTYIYDMAMKKTIRKSIIPYVATSLVTGFLFLNNTDNFAHLGGFVGGYLMGKALGAENEYGHKTARYLWTAAYCIFVSAVYAAGIFGFRPDLSFIFDFGFDFIRTLLRL